MFFRAAVDLHDELAKEEVRTVRNSHNSFLWHLTTLIEQRARVSDPDSRSELFWVVGSGSGTAIQTRIRIEVSKLHLNLEDSFFKYLLKCPFWNFFSWKENNYFNRSSK
jgi:hypothetical protein